jgi:hypothetical protein
VDIYRNICVHIFVLLISNVLSELNVLLKYKNASDLPIPYRKPSSFPTKRLIKCSNHTYFMFEGVLKGLGEQLVNPFGGFFSTNKPTGRKISRTKRPPKNEKWDKFLCLAA